MKIKTLLLLLLISFTTVIHAAPKTDSVKILNEKISELNEKIESNKQEISSAKDYTSSTFNSLSLQIGFSGVSLAVVGIVLGIWVNKRADKAQEILLKVDDKLIEIRKIEDNVKFLSDTIIENKRKLYEELKDEEVEYIIRALKTNPNDFHLYTTAIQSRHSILRKHLKDFVELIPAIRESQIVVCLNIIIKYFGVIPIVENELLAEKLIPLSNLIERLTIEQLKEMIAYLGAKKDSRNLSEKEKIFVREYFFPMLQQRIFHPHPLYQFFVEKFGEGYAPRHYTYNEVKSIFEDFLKIEPFKYPTFAPYYNSTISADFGTYLNKKNLSIQILQFDSLLVDALSEHFTKDERYFKQD